MTDDVPLAGRLVVPVALVAVAVVTGGALEFMVGDQLVGINTAQVAVAAVAVLGVVAARRRGVVRVDLLALPVLALAGWTVVQGIVLGVGPTGAGGTVRLGTVGLLLLAMPQFAHAPGPGGAGATVPPPRRALPTWDVAVAAMGVALALITLVKVVPALGDDTLGFYDLKDVVRLPLGNHNYVGAMLAACLAVVVTRPQGRTWWTASAAVMTLGLGVTLSRGAWLAVAVVLAVLALVRRDRATLVAVGVLGGAGVVALAAVVVLGGGATDRLATLFSPASGARYELWSASWRAFLGAPVAGVGIDRLAEVLTDVRQPYLHAHTLVLESLATTGVVGTVAYLGYWGGIARRVVGLDDPVTRLRVGLPLLALFVHAQVDSLSLLLVFEVVVATVVGVAAARPGAPWVREVAWPGRGTRAGTGSRGGPGPHE